MNILINGATRGIGLETLKALAGNPENKIIITGRNAGSLAGLAGINKNLYPVTFDLMNFDLHSSKLIDAVKNNFDFIDILINSAGALIAKDFLSISEKDSRMMMETNFFGPASIIRILHPFMRKGSHILNISSMGGFQGASKYRGLAYYSASKAAIACLTECLATEFAGNGISVNCLALGAVQTEMFEEAFPGAKAPVSAEDMGGFVAEFALNAHKFFNGKILPVALSNPR